MHERDLSLKSSKATIHARATAGAWKKALTVEGQRLVCARYEKN
jgi:hypothetical protein